MKDRQTIEINSFMLLVFLAATAVPVFARPPRVIEAVPENGAQDVDPKLKEIRIVFDQDMDRSGYSICGGGPRYPKTVGRPRWIDKRTLTMRVKLLANHDYRLSINCPSAQNCRNVNGEPARRYPLRFRTGLDGTGGSTVAEGAPPKVIEMVPENGARNVDPKLKEIRVIFDQDMDSRGYSICGGGPQFPKLIGKPRWVDKRTIVMRVELLPNHQYSFSINCPSAGNFRSSGGISAEPYPVSFRIGSGGVGAKERVLSRTDNVKAIEELRRAIDRDYSYRDIRGVDWDRNFAEKSDELKAAETAEQFAAVAGELLAEARDKHIWLYVGEQRFSSYVNPVKPNANFSRLERIIPDWRKRSAVVYAGRFDDGIGYIRIDSWGESGAEALEQLYVALWEFDDAPGLVIDVRGNGGGSEPLAQQFAGCFVDETRLYAQHVYRAAERSGGFTELQKRMLEPNKKRPKYRGRIAVLTGPVVMSSCEAFLLMMRQVPGCKLVGLPSQGSSGNPKPHELSNGVTVFLPSWKALRPDVSCFEGEGIKPDILVEANEIEFITKDQVVEAALEYLRGS